MTTGLALLLLLAQEPGASPGPRPLYRVGPGDVLEVTVAGRDDLSRAPTVQTDGTIALPRLGPVAVGELTLAEIERKLTNLLAGDVQPEPSVRVEVRQYESRFVTAEGELNRPGRKPLRGRMRLLDLLVEAGGFTPNASGEIVVRRLAGTFEDGSTRLTLRLGRTPTLRDQVNLGVVLENGDVVSAAAQYHVTVQGEVARPGRYPVDAGATLGAVIELAGGATRLGSGVVKLRRVDPATQQPRDFEIDLKAVREGRQPDLTLQPNDVITLEKRGP